MNSGEGRANPGEGYPWQEKPKILSSRLRRNDEGGVSKGRSFSPVPFDTVASLLTQGHGGHRLPSTPRNSARNLSKGGNGEAGLNRRGFLRLLTLAGASGLLPRGAAADSLFTNKFVFARLKYQGGDWETDMRGRGLMPGSELELLERLVANTRILAEVQEFAISPDDRGIANYPFLYITGHDRVQLTRTQMETLRAAILGGSFLFADDCGGASNFHRDFKNLMRQILPEQKFEILPMSHPLFHCMYEFNEILGGDKLVNKYMEGITLDDRLAVLFTDNDLGCAWEGHPCRPDGEKQREHAYRLGMNIVAYALTH